MTFQLSKDAQLPSKRQMTLTCRQKFFPDINLTSILLSVRKIISLTPQFWMSEGEGYLRNMRRLWETSDKLITSEAHSKLIKNMPGNFDVENFSGEGLPGRQLLDHRTMVL